MEKEDVVYTYEEAILFSHKKKEILQYEITWMDLEGVIQSEISQTEKDKYCMISNICVILKKKKTTHRYREQMGEWQWNG